MGAPDSFSSSDAASESAATNGLDLGIFVYGFAALALGVIGVVWGDFAAAWQRVPADLPYRTALAYAMGAAEALAGAAMLWRRPTAWGAMLFAALNAVILVFVQIPRGATDPVIIGAWGGVAETGAAMLGGILAFLMLRSAQTSVVLWRACWSAYGLCCVVFGVIHFKYLDATATMVPKYLPLGETFWAGATGVAHIAGGLALISGIRARLGAQALTAMFLTFQVMVHLPVLLKDPTTHFNWTINAWNLVLVGSAWIVADSLRRRSIWK